MEKITDAHLRRQHKGLIWVCRGAFLLGAGTSVFLVRKLDRKLFPR